MAETCLTRLNFRHIKDPLANPFPDSRGTPFLGYSSLYWGADMRIELSDRAKSFVVDLLEYVTQFLSTLLANSAKYGSRMEECDPCGTAKCNSGCAIKLPSLYLWVIDNETV